jgi:hypothetical protein
MVPTRPGAARIGTQFASFVLPTDLPENMRPGVSREINYFSEILEEFQRGLSIIDNCRAAAEE